MVIHTNNNFSIAQIIFLLITNEYSFFEFPWKFVGLGSLKPLVTKSVDWQLHYNKTFNKMNGNYCRTKEFDISLA